MLKKKLLERAINDRRVNKSALCLLNYYITHLDENEYKKFKRIDLSKTLNVSRQTILVDNKLLLKLGYIKYVIENNTKRGIMLNLEINEIEKITFELLLSLQEKAYNYTKESKNYDSESSPLFITVNPKEKNDIDYYIFNPKNWNGGDDLIRQLIITYEDDYELFSEKENENLKFIYRHQENDNKSFSIIINNSDVYNICWYKKRGNTENILLNGRTIDMEDYIELLNYLQDNNIFIFDLTIWDK